MRAFLDCVKDWQTLITGFLAIAAAWWAAHPIFKQNKILAAQAAVDLLELVERDLAQIADENKCLQLFQGQLSRFESALHILVLNKPPHQTPEAIEKWLSRHNFNAPLDAVARANLNQADTLSTRALDDQERSSRLALLERLRSFIQTCDKQFRQLTASQDGGERQIVETIIDFCRTELKEISGAVQSLLDSLKEEDRKLRERAVRLRKAAAD